MLLREPVGVGLDDDPVKPVLAAQLVKAAQLSANPDDLFNRGHAPYLAEAMHTAGVERELVFDARQQP